MCERFDGPQHRLYSGTQQKVRHQIDVCDIGKLQGVWLVDVCHHKCVFRVFFNRFMYSVTANGWSVGDVTSTEVYGDAVTARIRITARGRAYPCLMFPLTAPFFPPLDDLGLQDEKKTKCVGSAQRDPRQEG